MSLSTLTMADAAYLNTVLPPGVRILAGYLPGGDQYHAWTPADWQTAAAQLTKVGGGYLLPIFVPGRGMSPGQAVSTAAAGLDQIGAPPGTLHVLDREADRSDLTAAWVSQYVHATSGPVMGYTSMSTSGTIASCLYQWIAIPSRTVPPLPPAVQAVQWAEDVTGPGGTYDASVVLAGLPLWSVGFPTPPAPPAPPTPLPKDPPVPTLNADIVTSVPTPTGNGYWDIASDGGIFPFGDAMSFPTNPVPTLKLNRPIVAAVASKSGKGLLLTGGDGGKFAIGDATIHGSLPASGWTAAPQAPVEH